MNKYRARLCGITALVLVSTASGAGTVALATKDGADDRPTFTERYRPRFHFTPAKNWMNDPNGLVYYKGEYHLFFQYNPDASQWGNISWGHAVSKDLVHWKQLPLAIPHDEIEYVFSGSAVVDVKNTSGFGTKDNPPMVAIYTSALKQGPGQNQALAYSLDRGRSWTKYGGNPVLDLDNEEFRDPKVAWDAQTNSWRMAVVKATEHKVAFYSSPDLKSWTHLSDFGPQGAVGGVWECPDLFPLPVNGDRHHRKWVLVVSLNPGGIAGGSGTQYFVGDWDGTTFTPDDDGSYTPPDGLVLEDFESPEFGDWTTTGTAFGPGPAPGAAVGTDQSGVTGYLGERLANSFHGFDASTGTLTSPPFTADSPYLNFLVGGGNHPHDPEATLDPPAPEAATMLADFEGSDYGDWTTTGEAFGDAPATGAFPGQQAVSGFEGTGLVNTFIDGDAPTGTLTSPAFEITSEHINFLIGGGRHPMSVTDPTAVNLLIDGQVARTATGQDAEHLNWESWDVTDLVGRTAQIQVVDQNTGGWGHLNLDSVMLSDAPAQRASDETTVNLEVDGTIVQSATGSDSGTLDWASFDLRPYAGKQVRIKLIDANTGGWGQILADQFVAADEPAKSAVQRANWLDYGKDYYAAVSWNDAPDGRRLMIGWMSNWQYAGNTPTSPWRSSMSVPRRVELRTVGAEPQLVQRPVHGLQTLREKPAVRVGHLAIPRGSSPVPGVRGAALDLRLTLRARDAEDFGLVVRRNRDQRTVIGYDVAERELYVDRTLSGAVDFSPQFPGVQHAPLNLRNGRLRLRVLVDSSSVEVFAKRGRVVITDQIFPDPDARGLRLFSKGGQARLTRLAGWDMKSYRR